MNPGDRFEGTNKIMSGTVWEIEAIVDNQVRYKVIADRDEKFIGTRGRDYVPDLQFALDNRCLQMVSTITLDGALKQAYANTVGSGGNGWLAGFPSAQAMTPTPSVPSAKSSGLNCKRCKESYPYAEPNQPDGSMICYGCRNS